MLPDDNTGTKSLTSKTLPKSRALIGIWLKIASVVLFVSMMGIVKTISHVPVGEMVFFRSIIALMPILLWYFWRGELTGVLYTSNIIGHFGRGFFGILAMTCMFYSVILLPLPEAVAISHAMPLILVILCAIFLHENVRFYRWSAVIAGLSGVLIILWPRLTLLSGEVVSPLAALGAIIALTGAFLSALAHFLMRKLVFTEKTSTIVIYFAVIAAFLSLFSLPFGWIIPDGATFLLLCVAGLVGGMAQIFLTASYRYAEPSIVAPFEYVSMIVALIGGYFIFDEVPTLLMLFGGAIVMGSGIFIIYRENQLTRRGKSLAIVENSASSLP